MAKRLKTEAVFVNYDPIAEMARKEGWTEDSVIRGIMVKYKSRADKYQKSLELIQKAIRDVKSVSEAYEALRYILLETETVLERERKVKKVRHF